MIKKLVLLIVIIVLCVGLYFWFARASMISNFASKMLKVPVKIEAIDISLGGICIKGMEIGNAKGAVLPTSFKADKIEVQARFLDFLGNEVHIKDITVTGPLLGLEMYNLSGSDNNWTRILNNLSPAQPGQPAQPPAPPKEAGKGKQVIIDHVLLSNLQVNAYNDTLKTHINVPVIPKLELNNVGGQGSTAVQDAMSQVIQAVLKGVTQNSSLKNIFDAIKTNPGGLIKGLFSSGQREVPDEGQVRSAS